MAMTWWVGCLNSGASYSANLDGHRRRHRTMQTRRDLKGADVANLLGKLEIAAFERRPKLALDCAGHIRRRH
jgi:hypothetical protein